MMASCFVDRVKWAGEHETRHRRGEVVGRVASTGSGAVDASRGATHATQHAYPARGAGALAGLLEALVVHANDRQHHALR